MKNDYIDYEDGIIAIKVDGESKYGLHVLINSNRLKLVSSIDGYWRLN